MTGRIARPFDAYLPRPDLAEQVLAPPYDSLGIDDDVEGGNPLSFLNVIRAEVDHPARTAEERRMLLGETAARLRTLIHDGVYRHYPAPVYFVCRLAQHGHSQTGVIADVPVAAYDDGRIKVHESTRRGQEDRLVDYMQAVRANFLPLFLIHRPERAVDACVAAATAEPPDLDVDAGDGLRITVWVVAGAAQVAAWEDALGRLDALYVADGHHRAAAASRFAAAQRAAYPDAGPAEPWQRVLAGLFPSDQLTIHAYHRCLRADAGFDPGEFLRQVGERFELKPLEAPAPPGRGEVAIHAAGVWHLLRFPAGLRAAPGVAGLDVTLLHDHVLEPMAGVADPRTDPRLEFVPGTLGLGELERLCGRGYAACFALHPLSVDELLEVADRREIMPPKSTWFTPKLRSGLVVRLL